MRPEIIGLVKAAGKGKRMALVTKGEASKTLIEIGGISVLERTLKKLQMVTTELIVVARFGDEAVAGLAGRYARVVFQDGGNPGTAGAVEAGLSDEIVLRGESRLLVVGGDDSSLIPAKEGFIDLIDFHFKSGAICTTLGVKREKETSAGLPYFVGQDDDCEGVDYTGVFVARTEWVARNVVKILPDLVLRERQISRIFELGRGSGLINMWTMSNPDWWNSFNTREDYLATLIKQRRHDYDR